MNNKLVYLHLKPCGEVFYVGYGSLKRAYSKNGRNKYWKNIVNKYNYNIEIIKDNLSKTEAQNLEIELIKQYGRKDLKTGTLCNKTNGGDGGNGLITFTKEHRNKISISNTGKTRSDEIKQKLSDIHKGIKLSKESIRKRTISNGLSEKYKNGTSKYKGVSWCKKRLKWRANIYDNNKQNHLGYFNTEIEAYEKYKEFLELKILNLQNK